MVGFPTGKTQPHWQRQQQQRLRQVRAAYKGEARSKLSGNGKSWNKRRGKRYEEQEKGQRWRQQERFLSGHQRQQAAAESTLSRRGSSSSSISLRLLHLLLRRLPNCCSLLHPLSSADAPEPPPPPREGVAAEADDGHSEDRPPSSTVFDQLRGPFLFSCIFLSSTRARVSHNGKRSASSLPRSAPATLPQRQQPFHQLRARLLSLYSV